MRSSTFSSSEEYRTAHSRASGLVRQITSRLGVIQVKSRCHGCQRRRKSVKAIHTLHLRSIWNWMMRGRDVELNVTILLILFLLLPAMGFAQSLYTVNSTGDAG